jgi:hypothetical protein
VRFEMQSLVLRMVGLIPASEGRAVVSPARIPPPPPQQTCLPDCSRPATLSDQRLGCASQYTNLALTPPVERGFCNSSRRLGLLQSIDVPSQVSVSGLKPPCHHRPSWAQNPTLLNSSQTALVIRRSKHRCVNGFSWSTPSSGTFAIAAGNEACEDRDLVGIAVSSAKDR